MNTYEDLILAVQSDNNVNDTSPLFPLSTVKSAINRAYIKSAGLFRWPGTESAKKTTTQANQEYYDYPRDFRDDSIWRIEIDDVQWGDDLDGSALKFLDYLAFKSDDYNKGSTRKIWANQKRRFFIYPVPTTAGQVISVWGQRIVDSLSDNNDITIFSYSMPECNEAIVLEASAILKSKGEEDKPSEFRSAQAKQLLVLAWNKIQQEQSKLEKDLPFFDVPDFFSGNGNSETNIGNF